MRQCRTPHQQRKERTISIEKKQMIHRLIIERIAHDLSVFAEAAKAAHEASIHEENIPDNKYDTLSLEASYLAQGQANRAQEIKLALQAYQRLELQRFDDDATVRLTALVTLEAEDGEVRTVFIGPEEGGLKIDLAGEEVLVITPGSPLGSDLIGRGVGEVVQLGTGRSCKEFEITGIC